MDILILGNGFDLAHGLKTKYSDFLGYCRNKLNYPPVYKISNVYFTNMWIRHFLTVPQQMGNTWIDLENEIYNVVKHIAKSSIINTQNFHGIFSIDFNNFYFNFYDFDKYLSDTTFSTKTDKGFMRIDENNCITYHVYFDNPKVSLISYIHSCKNLLLLLKNIY